MRLHLDHPDPPLLLWWMRQREMTAVVDVDANPEILTPDCHKLYQFYILNSYKASVRI